MIKIIFVALAAFLIVALFITVTKKMFKVALYVFLFLGVFTFLGTKFLPGFDLAERGNSYIVGKAGEVVDIAQEKAAGVVQGQIDEAKQALKKEVNQTIAEVKDSVAVRLVRE